MPRNVFAAAAFVAAFGIGLPALVTAQEAGRTPTTFDSSAIQSSSPTWKGAFEDSFRLLLMEHSLRVAFQEKTRRELSGPFFGDYLRSLKMPDSWGDGDSWNVNYIGHPIHGAAAGFIWLDHEPRRHDPSRGFSKEYWASRGRATLWAAAYSLQYEFGPLSEASIGNVGMHASTTGWVDHVVTPAGAFGFMVAEDALDRYLVTSIESWTGNRLLRAVSRVALNPSRAISNVAQGRAPYYRLARPIGRN